MSLARVVTVTLVGTIVAVWLATLALPVATSLVQSATMISRATH